MASATLSYRLWKDEGGRMKAEKDNVKDNIFSSFRLHPSSFRKPAASVSCLVPFIIGAGLLDP
jgi:hypothetical protein